MNSLARTRPAWRWRMVGLLAVVVLAVGVVPASVSALTNRDPNRRVLSPVVSDGSGYLNNGYSRGARLLTLPGNLVGLSSDGTIAATRTSGGQVKGYRLSDGQVAWQVSGDLLADCPYFQNPEGYLWYPTEGNSGVVKCEREGGDRPFAALNLRTGEWTDFGFLAKHPEFRYSGLDDRFIYVTARDNRSGETRFVSLDFDGREVSSVTLFRAGTSAGLERTKLCLRFEDAITCHNYRQFWIFDAETGELKQTIETDGVPVPTADGYWVDRSSDVQDFYNRAGEWVGSSARSPYCLKPYIGVRYANADYMKAVPSDCRFSLVGPSGRVFAEGLYGESSCLLTQAGKRVPIGIPPFLRGHGPDAYISSDESVIAILPQDYVDKSPQGARLFDPYTGELIASFPLERAFVQSGIIYWTSNQWDPEDPLGTQVLVPGA